MPSTDPPADESTQTPNTEILNRDIKKDDFAPEPVQPTDESTQTPNIEIPNRDIQKDDFAPEPDQTTTLDANKNENISTPEISIPQIPHSDANVHDTTTTSTQDPPEITEIPPTNPPTGNANSTSDPPLEPDERKQLVNLINQEIKFVQRIYPKLGKHQEHLKQEAETVLQQFEKLKEEPCELKELKDMKKIVTKLKLQIPAKYRTYDENDPQKKHESDMKNLITSKLMKKMPQLHNKQFHKTPFCKTIQLRYHTLRRELKLCLLCFSVFPENAVISRRLMVYWWIGEGLVSLEDPSKNEDHANNVFRELVEDNFIEPVSKGHKRNYASCKLHPMVRAALVMIADQVKFFDFDEFGNPKDFGKFDEIESPEDVPIVYPLGDPREFFDFFDKDGNDILEPIKFIDEKGNPLQFAPLLEDKTITPVDCNEKPIDTNKKHYFYKKKKITTKSHKVCLMGSGLSKGITWEKLHMLFNVKDDTLEFKPEWFLRMKNVNVVFLGRWKSSLAHHIEVEEFKFEESLEHMHNVRFFSLQGVSRISELPKSISNLESLLILDLRACHNLEVIPKTIGHLKCLTHLDLSECYLLEHMPKEISSLVSLQVLKGFVVNESPRRNTCTLHDLKKCENLRKLNMYTHMKEFPQETHLDALQKLEALRKLTILWGGQDSDPKTGKPKKENKKKNKDGFPSSVMKLVQTKQWVKGKMRRQNAFNTATLGSRLEKLDLKCFPLSERQSWLTPGNLQGLKKLYIRGGYFSDLGQYQDVFEWSDVTIPPLDTWNVEVLRLKYLDEVEMNWRELQELFPNLTSLEKVKCPKLTLFPCNERGVWIKKMTTTEY